MAQFFCAPDITLREKMFAIEEIAPMNKAFITFIQNRPQ